MSMVSPRRRILLWALVIFVGAALLLLVVPMIQKRLILDTMDASLNNARQLQIAMQMMALDSSVSGENSKGGGPFDLGIKTKKEFVARLVRENYLSASDAAKLSEEFAIVNTSGSDSPETAFVVSDWYFHPERTHSRKLVIFTIGGSGGAYSRAEDVYNPDVIKLPNRQPQILPDE